MIFSPIKHLAIIAPSGPADRIVVAHGIALLKHRLPQLKVSVMPNVFKGCGVTYLSASKQERLDDLHRALNMADVDMIMCARGGYGAVHLLDGIDYDLMRERNLPLLGLSDITSLHLAMLSRKAGRPWATPMGIRLERLLNDVTAQRMFEPLFSNDSAVLTAELLPLKHGDAEFCGYPVVANLAVLAAQVGSEFLPDFTNKVLILEDIGEAAYRLDRYLMQLANAGILQKAAGVIFGQFTNCAAEDEIAALINRFMPLIPGFVYSNFPFGHSWPITAVDLTRKMTIKNGVAGMI